MIFRSQLRRQAMMNCVLIFIPNIIIAAVIAWFMDGRVLGFAIAGIGLLALGIAYWLVGSIVEWAAWLLVGRRIASSIFSIILSRITILDRAPIKDLQGNTLCT